MEAISCKKKREGGEVRSCKELDSRFVPREKKMKTKLLSRHSNLISSLSVIHFLVHPHEPQCLHRTNTNGRTLGSNHEHEYLSHFKHAIAESYNQRDTESVPR